ncbi:site-specific integrase [Myroides sp. M-43]|uniref:phage integrase SAM-like domain-containing protein n=2 Tax=Myroides TaxID=76831 RepID=UPI001E4D0511|nr:phage integrase SAM-like domain-containing protein [Myroides oncorhynchi]MCC9043856.1 site-specific integrase [Myroides oncorhynchi]
MAGITFLYRSSKDRANLILRLRYTYKNIKHTLDTDSKVEVTKEYWENIHLKNSIRDINKKNEKLVLEQYLFKIENFILKEVEEIEAKRISKRWLDKKIKLFYNPSLEQKIPTRIFKYIDYYLEYRKHELSSCHIKKYTTLKNKIRRLEKAFDEQIHFNTINEKFRKKFESYYKENEYSQNTLQREFVSIKTLCNHARSLGVHTNMLYDTLTFKKYRNEHIIFFTKDELDKICYYEFEDEFKYLETARDWLVISCYTGQRVSDFMRFKSEMIMKMEGRKILQIQQKKTKKHISVPLHSEVERILDYRNGEFPKALVDQEYNKQIKELTELIGINDLVHGGMAVQTKHGYRKKVVKAEKYNFVTTHIGRRTFATLYYGKMPTSLLKDLTGHSTEAMLLTYIGKNKLESAVSAFKYIDTL